jgi:gamma-glutamyltranspeptidase
LTGTYLDWDLHTLPPPSTAGPSLLVALNIAEALEPHHRPRRDASGTALYEEIAAAEVPAASMDAQTATASEKTKAAEALSKDRAVQLAAAIRVSTTANRPRPPATRE